MRQTILLADDSPTIRRLVNQTLADSNFRIVEVNNGDAAIKSFEEIRPNVVLADIYMPGKNGYQVCAYIRSHAELNRTPVVLLVGAFEAFDEDTAKQAGATASIKKPFEPSALIELVASVLRSDHESHESHEMLDESAPVAAPAREPAAPAVPAAEADDLLGLESIFKEEIPPLTAATISEADIDRIADRVLKKLSAQVVENIAWEILPDITEKIVREELKRINES